MKPKSFSALRNWRVTKKAQLFLLLTLALSMTLLPAAARSSDDNNDTLVLDVAVDHATMALSFNHLGGLPPPVRGDAFIVNGTIYPGGTLPTGTATNLPSDPGGIGNWICRGIFVANGKDIASGAAPITVDTTQLFMLNDSPVFVTEGLEPNSGGTTDRIVTGGPRGISAHATQETLGRNATGGFNVRLTFKFGEGRP